MNRYEVIDWLMTIVSQRCEDVTLDGRIKGVEEICRSAAELLIEDERNERERYE